MATKKNEEIIEIKRAEIVTTTIRIKGDTPLIVHAWSTKAKRTLLDAHLCIKKLEKREPKSPVEDFIDSMYWMSDEPTEKTEDGFVAAVKSGARWGFPVTAIKQAANSAAYRNGLVKNQMALRGAYYIDGVGAGQLAEIKGCMPVMREDMVRVGMGTADIRFRGQFDNWYMDLNVRYDKNGVYSLEQIVNLINLGGFCCGIGEWRPERDGQYGMYHVEAI